MDFEQVIKCCHSLHFSVAASVRARLLSRLSAQLLCCLGVCTLHCDDAACSNSNKHYDTTFITKNGVQVIL